MENANSNNGRVTDLRRLQQRLDRINVRHETLPGTYTDNFATKLFLCDRLDVEFLFDEKTEQNMKL